MKFASRIRSLKPRRVRLDRQWRPGTEQFEPRQLMAANAFLQGVSFIDANTNGKYDGGDPALPGATVALYRGATQIGSATTDARGVYSFKDGLNLFAGETLEPGAYRLVETPPASYVNAASQALSQLNPATSVDARTIDVTIVDPSSVWDQYQGPGTFIQTSFTLTDTSGNIINASGRTGNYINTLGTSSSNTSNLSGPFNSFCTDILATVRAGNIFQVTPKPADQLQLNATGNGPKVAYLYNKFINQYGTTPSSSIPSSVACAYQIAIWELIRDADPDLTAGNVKNVVPSSDAAATLSLANDLLNEAKTGFGLAMYLEAVGPVGASQSQIAAFSLNFGNLPASSLSGYVYSDANNDGSRAGDAGISGQTVTLTGVDVYNRPVSLVATTDADGKYLFPNLLPGTYRLSETQPANFLDGKDTIGTPGGTSANDLFSAIVLGAGVNGTENNFGELAPASISGYVYNDANNNGAKDSGEAGIPNASVTLTGIDDLGNAINTTVQTDSTGLYTFPNLRPGTYTITESQPAGFLDGKDTIGTPGGTTTNDVFSNIVLGAGVNGADNNFGELLASSISGYVYADANNDGVFQGTEAPIPGASLLLTGTDDLGSPVNIPGTTDANGFYSFTGLRPGTYTITESQPNGFLDGKDTIGTPGGTTTNDVFSNIVLGAGVNGADNNFGELVASSISGYVYLDDNNDGDRTGEAGLGGVTVTLSGTDDLGQPVSRTTTTLSTGNVGFYSFGNLRPGTYTIAESQHPDTLDGKDTIGTPGGNSTVNDVFSNIVLPSNFNGTENNFGELLPATVKGSVYYDVNNNGVREIGEPGITGATVTLTGTDDLGQPINRTVTTDSNGNFQFTALRPGTYTLNETQPDGYLDGKDAIGTQGGTAGNDVFSNFVLVSGSVGADNNFGELLGSAISGYVYADSNNDGARTGDVGIGGVTVTLTGTDDLGQPVNLTTTTLSTGDVGFYSFGNLRPGTYSLTETQPTNFLDGKDTIGTPGGTSADDVFSNINLPVNFSGTENNFGELRPSSLSGFVYADANNNGVKETGEAGIPNASVTLTGLDDRGNAVNITVQTDSTGKYTFPNLRPGTYVLTESQPANFLDGKDTVGTPGGVTTNDAFSVISLGVGVDGINNNFGELAPASLSGFVYNDANNNGTKDTGEAGIPNASVTLTGTDDLGNAVNTTVQTDSTGKYTFPGLRPGTYTITESQPGGFLDGKDAIGTPGGTAANDLFSAIALGSGVVGENNNFGELLPSSIAGFVYVDANNNGVFDTGEAPISGVTVTLTGTDDLGSVSRTVTTSSTGAYSFGNLRPGTYTVTESQPPAFADGKDTLGTVGGITRGTLGADTLSAIALASGDAGINYNFGELNPIVTPPPGNISGKKVIDVTGNGLSPDDTAPTVAFTIQLWRDVNNNNCLDSGDTFVTSTRTAVGGDAPGSYSFNNVPAGRYLVREVVPAGYVRTAPTFNDYYAVTINSTTTSVNNLNFANFVKDCCCDPCNLYFLIYSDGCTTPTKVYDLRGNVDQGDLVKVVFTVPYGATDEYTLVSYTAPQSYFDANRASEQKIFDVETGTFTAGTYSLTVQVPNSNFQIDFVCGKAIDKFGPAGSNIFYTPQGRLISADNDGRNAPLANPGSLAGNVYLDVDQDGIRDAGEKGIANVPVYLTGSVFYPGSSTARTINLVRFTDSNGKYDFMGLPKGTYRIVESQPAGYTSTRTMVGKVNGIVDGFISSNTSNTISSITLDNGENGVDYNYGEIVTKNICSGQTATSYYWKTWDGQNLIKCFNGGSSSTKLGNWLASCFPNLYGSSSPCNLAGKTNAEVCNYYLAIYNAYGKDAEQECFAAALNCYATTSWLGGKEGCNYGFSVCDQGLGGVQIDVGCYGSSIGCSNYSDQTVYNCLRMVNDQSSGGNFCGGSSSRKGSVYNMFRSVNCS